WLKTLDFLPRDEAHLRRILRGGERADGSSLFPGAGITTGASDVVLQPRAATAFLDPFARIPTLVVRCGHAGPDGHPLALSPDTIVRRADRRCALDGLDLLAHGEIEFFLGKRPDETGVHGADERGYHAASPFVFGEALRREALVRLDEMGIPVKYGHSEVGYVEPDEPDDLIWEQHEIELDLLPLPEAADAILLTHWVLRNLAHGRGFRCSTEPMVARKHAGNGLHIHFAASSDGGRGDADDLTPAARWLIGGLVEMGGALMAFGNRSEASFTRLAQGGEVPAAIRWGACDRSALVRLPDGSAHPHLLLAGAAQAACHARGRDDLEALLGRTGTPAPAPGEAGGADALPRCPAEIAGALARHRGALEAGEVFPPAFIDALLADLRAGRAPA
ncbi:MAG: type I glutamate--ammonia ligase, partial [Planctomycetota bacterium]